MTGMEIYLLGSLLSAFAVSAYWSLTREETLEKRKSMTKREIDSDISQDMGLLIFMLIISWLGFAIALGDIVGYILRKKLNP